MHSAEGEVVPFSEKFYPDGNVEDWLSEVEKMMKVSLENILHRALIVYPEVGESKFTFCETFYSNLMSILISVNVQIVVVVLNCCSK